MFNDIDSKSIYDGNPVLPFLHWKRPIEFLNKTQKQYVSCAYCDFLVWAEIFWSFQGVSKVSLFSIRFKWIPVWRSIFSTHVWLTGSTEYQRLPSVCFQYRHEHIWKHTYTFWTILCAWTFQKLAQMILVAGNFLTVLFKINTQTNICAHSTVNLNDLLKNFICDLSG